MRQPLAHQRHRGVALVFVLLMLVVTASAALITARVSTGGERSTAYDRDRQIAFASAEMALNAAERDLFESGGVRGCMFGTSMLVAGTGCSVGIKDPGGDTRKDYVTRGVCGPDPSLGDKPIYQSIDWEESDDAKRKYVKYGEWGDSLVLDTVRSLQTGVAGAPAQKPKYIIVQTAFPVDITAPAISTSTNASTRILSRNVYRVYALGYGSSSQTQVMLEAVFAKPNLLITCTPPELAS